MLRIRTVLTGVAGSPWYNNIYTGGSVEAEAQTAAGITYAFWNALSGYVSAGISIDVDTDVAVINAGDGEITQIYSAATPTILGTNAADPLPRMTQMLVRLRTGGIVAGRRVQGRMFLPGWGEGSSTDGRPNPTDVAIVQGAIDNFLTDLGDNDVPLLVWSRPVTGGRVGSQHAVTSGSVWNEWSVLRSRRD